MKEKRFALLAGLFGLGGLAAAGAVAYQKAQEKRRQKVVAEVRQFFDNFGKISTIYLNPSDSKSRTLTGGVVFDDGVTFYFSYTDGDIEYKVEEV